MKISTAIVIFAVLVDLSIGAVARDAQIPVSSLGPINDLAFAGPTDELVVATHFGIYNVSLDGEAVLLSEPNDFQGFTRAGTNRMIASGHNARGGNMGILISDSGGRNWKAIFDGLVGPVDFHILSASPTDAAVVYGIFNGIQRSSDGGMTWVFVGPGPANITDIAVSSTDPQVLYAATATGLMRSPDSGATWAGANFDGMTMTAVEASELGDLYAFVASKGLYKMDHKGNWSLVSSEFGSRAISRIAIDFRSMENLAVLTDDGLVLVSTNGGKTWKVLGH